MSTVQGPFFPFVSGEVRRDKLPGGCKGATLHLLRRKEIEDFGWNHIIGSFVTCLICCMGEFGVNAFGRGPRK